LDILCEIWYTQQLTLLVKPGGFLAFSPLSQSLYFSTPLTTFFTYFLFSNSRQSEVKHILLHKLAGSHVLGSGSQTRRNLVEFYPCVHGYREEVPTVWPHIQDEGQEEIKNTGANKNGGTDDICSAVGVRLDYRS